MTSPLIENETGPLLSLATFPVCVIGISHHSATVSVRESYAKLFRDTCNSYRVAHIPLVFLSTCNRTELYTEEEHLPYLLSLLGGEQGLYVHRGEACFKHLSEVASGLDSACLGETEISGQTKLAYESARHLRPLTKNLHFLFQKSFKLAKLIHSSLQLEQGTPDLGRAILQKARATFDRLDQTRVLFIGTSTINLRILALFKSKGFYSLTLCNRTDERAITVAAKEDCEALPWSQFHHWPHFEMVVVATKCPHSILSREDVSHSVPRLIIDLSVPRNADPLLGQKSELLNIDDVQQLLNETIDHNKKKVELAKTLLEVQVEKQIGIFEKRARRCSLPKRPAQW